MLRPSFVPAAGIRDLRALSRAYVTVVISDQHHPAGQRPLAS
ncbi:hypothetical protein [Streptosporangium sp. NPDC087985]